MADLTEITEIFDQFNSTQVLAVGNDLAPHYFQNVLEPLHVA